MCYISSVVKHRDIGGCTIEIKSDKKWLEAKNLARVTGNEYNWIEVVSFYEELGGEHVQVYCSLEDGDKRRIVSPVDDEELVVTVKRNNDIIVDDYKEVFESKKIFIFAEHSEEKQVKIPTPYKVLEEDELTIYE